VNSTHDFLNIIVLLGFIQGVITSMLLFRLKINRNANNLLAWIILLISLACLNIYILETVENTSTLFNFLEALIPLVIIMPIGPLIYFYVKAILNPEFKLSKSNRPHFYSTLLDFIPNIIIIIFLVGGFLGLISSNNNVTWINFIDTYNHYIDIPRWISLVIYLWLTFKIISEHENHKKNEIFTIWAKRFTVGFTIFSIIWMLHLIPYSIPSLSNRLLGSVGWYPIYIPLIILVYWLGINGYIISFKTYKKGLKVSTINDKTIQSTISTLESLMQEKKLYLNPSLKLSDIVKETEIPQKTISAVLNQHVDKSFNDYINTYRVEAFKSRLLEENLNNLTITGIAFECGFNSQATFQRVFKANTNQSPSAFRKTHQKS